MRYVWHYTDKDGVRREESLTAEQAGTDQSVVQAFQGLEGAAASGLNLNSDKEQAAAVGQLLTALSTLPKERAAHWRAELKRIGVHVQEPKPGATTIISEARK